jgi:hypothetical protein
MIFVEHEMLLIIAKFLKISYFSIKKSLSLQIFFKFAHFNTAYLFINETTQNNPIDYQS